MKNMTSKNLLIFLFFLITNFSFSQSSLKFNQVLTQFGSLSGGYGETKTSQTFTVPAGKIWKLEKYTRDRLYVNGVQVKDTYLILSGNSNAVLDNAPLWLKEGDSFYFIVGGPPYGWTENWYFSLLEFNKN